MSPRDGASSMPGSTSSTRPQSQNRATNTTDRTHHRMATGSTQTQDSGSSFDLASFYAALPEINTRFESVEQSVDAQGRTLGTIQCRLDNVENDIKVIKGNLDFCYKKIDDIGGFLDLLKEDLSGSKAKMTKIAERINGLNVINQSLIDLFDSLNLSVQDVDKKNKAHDISQSTLIQCARDMKEHFTSRIDSINQKLEARAGEDSDRIGRFEATLLEIQATIASFQSPANIDIPGHRDGYTQENGKP